ncbi:MAG: SemiSWEET transporter [Parcubacteria group bacterium]
MNLITTLGLAAAACTTFAFLPQAVKTIKTKSTNDLSVGMYSMTTTGIFLWLVYGLRIKDVLLIAANVVTLVFTVTILFLIIKNTRKN